MQDEGVIAVALSIGAIGEIVWDPASCRFKGFLPKAHASVTSAVLKLASIARECEAKDPPMDARLTARLLFGQEVDSQLVRSIQLPWCEATITCEALIPLNSGLGSLAYFGANRAGRLSALATREAEWKLLSGILDSESRSRELPPGFRYEILFPDLCVADVHALVELYNLCFTDYMTAFTPDSVLQMLTENHVVGIRDSGGCIIAVGQAEEVRVETGRGALRLIELSENATHPDFHGRGFSQHCRIGLMRLLGEGEGNSLFYAEARAAHGSVLAANHKVGLKVAGRLDHHARCDSRFKEVAQEGEFGSFFVFYRPQS